ncbi:MAG: Gfo/Idh/MocA family oxidoreductase [Cyclobacteriaceae bacterium]|nr:Gfo/Idh/MocA family oxidoreductase [Cyclobacteriaceae bacterium]
MSQINRRDFIRKGALGAIGLTILPTYLKSAPSDRLRIAHIGLGGMGNQHLKWFSALSEVEIVALCDVDQEHLAATKKTLDGLVPGNKATAYEDFRHVLDRKDVDAITIATPDHWHASVAALAFQAGKDVYGEKPLSYSVEEGQIMLQNQQRYNRIFQLGTQIHAGDNYHRVVELIKSGVIGNVHTVRLWKNAFSPGLGRPVTSRPPRTLNYDMWLGPAPWADYFPERVHFNYRYFLDYSGGMFADFWCHIADVAWWAVEPKGLKRIAARGERTDGVADAPKWLDVDLEFENVKVYWTTQPPNVPGAAERNIGAYFEGDRGTLICDYSTKSIVVQDVVSVEQKIIRSPGHQQNFVDAVKTRNAPESSLSYARDMTLPMHLALISWRLNRPLQWDATIEKFISDDEANALLSRKARKQWDLIHTR